jgi:hypothetical protein
MSHLEQLKQQMMVKPNVQERERVAVVIKGEKRVRKPRAEPSRKIEREKERGIGEELVEGIMDLSEQISGIQEMEGILPVSVDVDEAKVKEEPIGRPLIVDRTEQGYDRAALLKKLAESKKSKVTFKPAVEMEEKEKEKVIEPLPEPIQPKKAKK